MAEATIPRPTPEKITPPTRPRRATGVRGRISTGACTIRMAPQAPATVRQNRNQGSPPPCQPQLKKLSAQSSIDSLTMRPALQ